MIIPFSTLDNSKLPPPRSATNPSTLSNPILTPSAEQIASSSPLKISIFFLKRLSTYSTNGFASVASRNTAVAIIFKLSILEIFKISENLFKTF